MADSEDEYDRKRRDKFRGERSSGDSYRTERRDDRRPLGGLVGAGPRDEWPERNPFRSSGIGPPSSLGGGSGRARPDYREYRGPRDRFGSPVRDMPPAKRMRNDWNDDLPRNPRFGGYDPYLIHAWNEHYAHSMHSAFSHAPHPPLSRDNIMMSETQTQPAMLTLKQFLDTQDDGISDAEVLRKYTEYKSDFKRQQLNEFFVTHKDEEWFKQKYHPEESIERKVEQMGFLKRRIDVYIELLDKGAIGAVKVDSVLSDPLIRLLDTVVIKLEGGTDDDLKALDEKPKEQQTFMESRADEQKICTKNEDDVVITSVDEQPSKYNDELPMIVSPHPTLKKIRSSRDEWDEVSEARSSKAIKKVAKKRKRSISASSSSSGASEHWESERVSSPSSSSDDDLDDKVKQKYDLEAKDDKSVESMPKKDAGVDEKDDKSNATEEKLHKVKDDSDFDEQSKDTIITKPIEGDISIKEKKEETQSSEENDKDQGAEEEIKETENKMLVDDDNADIDKKVEALDDDDTKDKNSVKNETNNADIGDEKKNDKNAEDADNKKEASKNGDAQVETIDLDEVKDEGPKPRALHRTSSIFLRNLAPGITKAEIVALCQRFNGYLRVAIADPLVERRWYRRGWITFQRDVNIKEICWSLNNQRIRDCEMGAIVNRDLSRRVRPTNGISAHKSIVRADIKLCAKIIVNLDERFNLWNELKNKSSNSGNEDDITKSNGNSTKYGFSTNNPVLENITDYLIEEASAEEDELLGISGENKDTENEGIDRDEQLISVLDRLVLYLRIVHSVDYYNHCEYPYEDEMPNRCGIIHARGPPPSKLNPNDAQDYIKTFENKLQQFLTKTQPLNQDEVKELGAKDPDAEVEKFIQANTQELAKDKWLCPLSGKKFKGPEFIRKHIFNKHNEKVDEVKKEVEYFNNYLRDPKRPQLPEHPGSNKRTNSETGSTGGGYRQSMYPPPFSGPPYGFNPGMMMSGGRGRGFGGPQRRELPLEHQRRIIGYHDLDAPASSDIFD